MPRGGKRPGAGKPKGYKHQHTLEKEAQLELLRQRVLARSEQLWNAQMEHACGVSYMVLRASDGTFARATDEKQIDAACAAGATAFRIFTQAPNTQAFTDLMNRTFGKPPERVEMTGKDGEPLQIVVKKPW